MHWTPARALVCSFLAIIALGTVALRLPGVCADGKPLGWIDSLFTATSAVCVTGLIVVDTGVHFTRLGHWIILALIQMGGLGILTFTTWVLMLGGARPGALQRDTMINAVGSLRGLSWRTVLRNVFLFTIFFEAIGTLLLQRAFEADHTSGEAWFLSLFHSISAFCNAGFSTLPGGLTDYADRTWVSLVIVTLFVVGGLGFIVLTDVLDRFVTPGRWHLTLHTRIVLAMTAVLLVGGTLAIAGLEWGGALGGMSFPHRWMAALFQAATPRTAGFNTVPIATLATPTLFVMILLMIVGASPGSTGGGLKTTTLAILVALGRSRAFGRSDVEAMERRIPMGNVAQALATCAMYGLTLVVGVIALALTESFGRPVHEAHEAFLAILFEATSALGTVGLSMDFTPTLSEPGRLIVIGLMLCGRLGPISVVLSFVGRRHGGAYAYPEEPLLTG